MKNGKVGEKIIFRKSYGDRKPKLLAAQNSWSLSCAPRFDQITIEKPQKADQNSRSLSCASPYDLVSIKNPHKKGEFCPKSSIRLSSIRYSRPIHITFYL